MTTLELAELIQDAVKSTHWQYTSATHSTIRECSLAVLKVLHEHSSWFCRVVESETGPTIETPYEQVQQELFK